ncbi:AAA family ATPase [Histomonas meleagridis]|uniref:AAA family ATPase n=1 Tax=Histomonas meleagridis TaxID=135588 RepID=UPI00355A1284|nr:AAA family ATPase [Histomonas meleagridis]KAH0798329.1 AAA family ATPase [Histomonas meleagridis]
MEHHVEGCMRLDLLRMISDYETGKSEYIDSILSMEDGILLIDDICILSKQGAVYLSDKLSTLADKPVLVIATSRVPPYSLPYVIQPFFQTSLHINALTHNERRSIINELCANMDLSNENIDFIVKETSGVTQGELRSLCQLVPSIVPFENQKFISIVKTIATSEKPLMLRHTSIAQKIGGYKSVVDEIRLFLNITLGNDSSAQSMLQYSGILLHGPSGNGKSLIIRSLCEEFEVPFFILEFDKIFSRYLGDSEKSIRDAFTAARFFSPCAIVIEDIDAIGAKRNDESAVGGRVLSTLLNEIDGITKHDRVLMIATTNAPDLIDSALIRVGRFDKLIEVGNPTKEDRICMFKLFMEKTPVSKDVSCEMLADMTEGYTCAEVNSFFRFSALQALQKDEQEVSLEYFKKGKERVSERKRATEKFSNKNNWL